MKTAWTIDVDHVTVPGEKSRVGCYGQLASEYPFRWRVKDADGNVYYEGRCSDDSSFAPLDFAQADAGATDIEYLDPATGRWVGL